MRVSIVLAVYNGEKYLEEQLETLRIQTKSVDEIIIMNDCSTDGTVSILSQFISQHNLENWKIVNNTKNLGWRRNFIEGMKNVSGEYVFLCDQDDLWHTDKIENMCRILENNDKILLLASNYNYLYEEGMAPIANQYTLNDKSVVKHEFSERFLYIERPGCVYAMRKKLVDIVVKEWYEGSAHDALAWRIADLLDGLYIYNEPTIEFRRHPDSATALKKSGVTDKIAACKYWIETIEKMEGILEKYVKSGVKEKKQILQCGKKFAQTRLKLYQTLNPFRWFLCVKYVKYYYSVQVMLGDMYYILRRS